MAIILSHCFYGYRDPGRFFTRCDSNGCAAGASLEEAAIEVAAAENSEFGAIAVLADAAGHPVCGTRTNLFRVERGTLTRDVIAATSGTVSSFRYMLTPLALDEPLDDEAAPSVLMLARAAGYKVFWISNQHDRYINPRFAEEADVQKLLNVGGKRGDRRLDEALIPEWQAALRDPAPRKLIIAHLLGAHPHYELRYPKAYSHYVGVQDEVSRKLADQGRMPWIRVQRICSQA